MEKATTALTRLFDRMNVANHQIGFEQEYDYVLPIKVLEILVDAGYPLSAEELGQRVGIEATFLGPLLGTLQQLAFIKEAKPQGGFVAGERLVRICSSVDAVSRS